MSKIDVLEIPKYLTSEEAKILSDGVNKPEMLAKEVINDLFERIDIAIGLGRYHIHVSYKEKYTPTAWTSLVGYVKDILETAGYDFTIDIPYRTVWIGWGTDSQ